MSREHNQLTRSEMIAAGRTVTVNCPLSTPAYDVRESSKDSFVRLSNDKLSDKTSDTWVGDDDSTDDFTPVKTAAFTDSDVIAIANSINITLPGLNQFRSAFDFIAQKHNESDFDFAMRRISALTPAFIQTDPTNPLNDWHMANRKDADKFDEALAETAYFYDETNQRLIIRHTPVEAVDTEAKKMSNELLENVTQTIINGLSLTRSQTHIEHVIPRIIAGRLSAFTSASRHIVLQIKSENDFPKKPSDSDLKDSSSDESNDSAVSVILDPRTNLFDTAGYLSLHAQEFLNNTDCGRHVLIMATVAAKIMAENKHKNAHTLTTHDMLQFGEIIHAKACDTVSELKKLLMQVSDVHFRETAAPTPYSPSETASWFSFSALTKLTMFGHSQSDLSALPSLTFPSSSVPKCS